MLCAAGVVLGSCGMREGKTGAGLPPTPPIVAAPGAGARVQDAPVKIGNPYQVGGQTYVPSDVPGYVNWTLLACAAHGGFHWLAGSAADWHTPYPGWPGTRYEAKAVRAGRQPLWWVFRRR